MLDPDTFLLILPSIITATFAYVIAQKKSKISERINKAKSEADVQVQALTIVRGAMNDMRDEFRRAIDSLKNENEALKKEVQANAAHIDSLREQLQASDVLVATLKSEISTLQNAIRLYQAENERLKQTK